MNAAARTAREADEERWLSCPACGQDARGRPGRRCEADGHLLVDRAALRDSPTDPLLGTIVGGHYEVAGVLGRGGFGDVYAAVQQPVGRLVALKILRSCHADGPTRVRFLREARILARLRNPWTVALHDFGEHLGRPYMVLEHVRGATLADVLDHGPLRPERAALIGSQLACGLAEAHAAGIVHRDLKPSNVMVTEAPYGGELVKLLDFGIASVACWADEEPACTAVGTPEFMAPEQIRGEPVDARTDVYGLGCLLWTLLAGEPPYHRAGSPLLVLYKHLDPEPPDVRDLQAPQAFRAIIARALAPEPADRFQSVAELRQALEAMLRPPRPAVPMSGPPPVVAPPRLSPDRPPLLPPLRGRHGAAPPLSRVLRRRSGTSRPAPGGSSASRGHDIA